MFRLASLFAFACLTLAATALLKAPKAVAQQPPWENENQQASANRRLVPAAVGTPAFHARFSLN